MKKILVVGILLCLFVAFQTSFLPLLFPKVGIVNLVMIAVLLMSILKISDFQMKIFGAFLGGFLLDVFSGTPLGFWVLILAGISLLLHVVFHYYVRFPFIQKS
ncbi:MAG: hypothetical protein AAB567_01395 [Patescibacteria group bacterium]